MTYRRSRSRCSVMPERGEAVAPHRSTETIRPFPVSGSRCHILRPRRAAGPPSLGDQRGRVRDAHAAGAHGLSRAPELGVGIDGSLRNGASRRWPVRAIPSGEPAGSGSAPKTEAARASAKRSVATALRLTSLSLSGCWGRCGLISGGGAERETAQRPSSAASFAPHPLTPSPG